MRDADLYIASLLGIISFIERARAGALDPLTSCLIKWSARGVRGGHPPPNTFFEQALFSNTTLGGDLRASRGAEISRCLERFG